MSLEQRLKHFTVLIVEDDRLIRKLIHDVLARLGFGNILKARDGQEALALLDSKPIDFIICDWRMPHMDGIAFTKKVRASGKAYALVPIIMLTGNAEKEHVIDARDAGVTEYLVKPFTVRDLFDRLKEIINNPREFVMAFSYQGPSRRRRNRAGNASERRKRSVKPENPTTYGR